MKPKDLNEQELKFTLDLIKTIEGETHPITGHDDPGAISDCWNELRERVQAMADHIRSDWRQQQRMSAILNSGDGVYRP